MSSVKRSSRRSSKRSKSRKTSSKRSGSRRSGSRRSNMTPVMAYTTQQESKKEGLMRKYVNKAREEYYKHESFYKKLGMATAGGAIAILAYKYALDDKVKPDRNTISKYVLTPVRNVSSNVYMRLKGMINRLVGRKNAESPKA